MKPNKITFGEHKGKDFNQIPHSYLLDMWSVFGEAYEKGTIRSERLVNLLDYIKDNLREIKSVVK